MPLTRAFDLAYVRLQVSDLTKSEQFFADFGLTVRARQNDTLYLCGAGPQHHLIIAQAGEPKVLAVGFEAASADDLLQLSAQVAGASAIEDSADLGGGRRVVLHDPDGNRIEVVHGISQAETVRSVNAELEFNSATRPLLRRNVAIRLAPAPSHVQRLGHVVRTTPSVERQVAWYHETLGLLSSDDVLHEHSDDLVMSFVRFDRSEEYVDHHALQFLKGQANRLHHISFEVKNLDDLYLGHEHLEGRGYTHVWGVGRHLQGSQIFDYWLDPDRVMFEHWTDSDRFNASAERGVIRIHDMAGPWGPPMPRAFLEQSSS